MDKSFSNMATSKSCYYYYILWAIFCPGILTFSNLETFRVCNYWRSTPLPLTLLTALSIGVNALVS
jgi:hypothetical protein